jgi:hypothetical protein
MDINSLQGSAAYANTLNATPPVENTQTREQNLAASTARLDEQTTRAAQQAFEVNITQEARDRLARETEENPVEEPAPAAEPAAVAAPEPSPAPAEETAPVRNTTPLVNIVA